MGRTIYRGKETKAYPMNLLEQALGEVYDIQRIAKYQETADFSSDSFEEKICYIPYFNVTLRIRKYDGGENPLLVEAFGDEQQVSQVEKIILDEIHKKQAIK